MTDIVGRIGSGGTNMATVTYESGTPKPRPGMRYTKCPSCNNTQAYTITLEARNIRCHNCSHTWQVPGKSSLGKLSKAQCPECGRTYEYNLIRPSTCPECKTPLKKGRVFSGKSGRCESIW